MPACQTCCQTCQAQLGAIGCFTRPELYDRHRPLFKRYVPLCKRVAEAGREPITLTRSSDPKVRLERFGDRIVTVFNDSPDRRSAVLTLEGLTATTSRDLLTGHPIDWPHGRATIALSPEDLAVLELR